ncbi:MAG: TetR/AcrR family transcriptional regulator [Chloroflexota bacterium]
MPYRVTEQGRQRRAERRTAILTAARELFMTQGYEETTMQQVVRAAGTSIGNCYFYFPNKHALLLALVDDLSDQIGIAFDQVVKKTADGPEQLAMAVYAAITTLLEQADIARLLLIETAQPDIQERVTAQFIERTERFFKRNPQLSKNTDPALIAHAWQGSIFYILRGVLEGHLVDDPEIIGPFLIRWNLQALGLSKTTIDEAVESVTN